MVDKNDWRLMGQERFLMEKQLLHKRWSRPEPRWDHDHCEFCGDKIDYLTGLAYCTTDQYHWICEECFNDFKEMFQWKVVKE